MFIYDLNFTDIDGNNVNMKDFEGNVMLLVNTASQCGFTKQYAELQDLHEKHKGDGLKIIGFPCNQFNNQEPGTNEDIKDFCTKNYGVTFLMSEKIDVRGDSAHPIYKFLTSTVGREIPWNFDKFIVDKSGNVTGLAPHETPETFGPFLESLLGDK
jgi:glutathione peroxidase